MKPRGLWWSPRSAVTSELIESAPDWEWTRTTSSELTGPGRRGPNILLVDHEPRSSGLNEIPWKLVPPALRGLSPPSDQGWIWIQVLPPDERRALDWRVQCAEAGCLGFVMATDAHPNWQKEFRQAIQSLRDPVLLLMRRIQAISGVNLPDQKRPLVESRLVRRAIQLGYRDLKEYLEYFLSHSHLEMAEVLSSVMTHTTHFFREPKHFDFLQREAVPRILSERRAIRAWSAASSTGQEAASIAICLHDLSKGREPTSFSPGIPPFSWSVLATDIDPRSVETASRGIYSESELRDLPRKTLADCFDSGTGELSGWWRLKNELHQQMQFKEWNLLDAAPPVKEVDILFLRNVLIYFQREEIISVLAKLEECIAPGGYLFVGHSESFVALGHSLEPVAAGVYRRSPRT